MMNYDGLPEHIRGGLQRYIEHRIEPGGFLMAVLENNLKEACGRADHINREKIFDIVAWLYNHAPAPSWGNPTKVAAWLASEV